LDCSCRPGEIDAVALLAAEDDLLKEALLMVGDVHA